MATVNISWTDNSNDENGFRVYRSTVTSPSFPNDYSQIDETGVNVTTYEDTSPPLGEVVSYAVLAFDDIGESETSTATIDLTLNVPDVSGVGVERRRNGIIESVKSNGLSANPNVGAPADKTNIYRTTTQNATFPDDYTLLDTVNGDVSDFEDSNLPFGTDVFYAMTVEIDGTESPPAKSNILILPKDAAEVNSNLNPAEANSNLNPAEVNPNLNP